MLAVEILIVVALILMNGVFAMSELAVVSSRRGRLQQMAESGDKGARTALNLVDDPSRFLSTVQIGITLVGIVAGAFGGATLGDRFGSWLATLPGLARHGNVLGIGIILVAITYLSIVLGELIPKRIALKSPERVAAQIARPMRLLSQIAAPMVWLLGTTTEAALRLLGLHGARESTVTEEEVKSLITEGTVAGVFAPQEKAMIDGVLRLADRTVRTIMTPRRDVIWLDVNDPQDAIIEEIRAGRRSRYPVCRGELDDVIGIVDTRSLLDYALTGRPFDLASCAVDALIVHDGTPVIKLLDLFKQSGDQIAVVVDEYGTVEGLVTLTDIMETIAGELPESGRVSEPDAVQREDGSWLIDGAMPIDEFEDVVGIRGLKDGGDFHTVAGFVLNQFGHIPTPGEAFVFGGSRYEVVDMDGRRIDKILVTQAPPKEAADTA